MRLASAAGHRSRAHRERSDPAQLPAGAGSGRRTRWPARAQQRLVRRRHIHPRFLRRIVRPCGLIRPDRRPRVRDLVRRRTLNEAVDIVQTPPCQCRHCHRHAAFRSLPRRSRASWPTCLATGFTSRKSTMRRLRFSTEREELIRIGRAGRLYLGEGGIDIASILAQLPAVPLSIEIPNPEKLARSAPSNTRGFVSKRRAAISRPVPFAARSRRRAPVRGSGAPPPPAFSCDDSGLGVGQVAFENGAEGEAIGDAKHAERADEQVHVERVHVTAENALRAPRFRMAASTRMTPALRR